MSPPVIGEWRELSESQIAQEVDQPRVFELFLLDAPDRPVYVGETLNLKRRLGSMLRCQSVLESLLLKPGSWQYRVVGAAGAESTTRRGAQSLRIGQTRPVFNYLDLGVAVIDLAPTDQ